MGTTENIILIVGLALLLLGIASFILWIWMLVHVLTKNTSETQIVWLVAMVMFGPIVSIIYYFVVKKPTDAKPFIGETIKGTTSFK